MKKNVIPIIIALAVAGVLYYAVTKLLLKPQATTPAEGEGSTPEPEETSEGIIDTIQDVFGLGDTETVEVIDEVETETTTTTDEPPPPPPAPTCQLMQASMIATLNSNDAYKTLNCISSEGYTTVWGDGNWGGAYPSTLNSSHCGRKLASLQQILNSNSANGGCIPVVDYGKATPLTLQKWSAAMSAGQS